MVAHTFLTVGTRLPVLHIHLIAADVYILRREEVEQLAPHVLTKLEHAVLAWAHRGSKEFAPPRLLVARQTIVVADSHEAVTRHVYLGYYFDAAHTGIAYHIAHLLLSIVASVLHLALSTAAGLTLLYLQVGSILLGGPSDAHRVLIIIGTPSPPLGKQWVALYLDTPALVVSEMPVQLVYLVEGEHVEEMLNLVDREEVTGAVELHATPVEARAVIDRHTGHRPRALHHLALLDVGRQQLAQRSYTVDNSSVVATHDSGSLGSNAERVGTSSLRRVERQAHAAPSLDNGPPVTRGCTEHVTEVLGGRAQLGIVTTYGGSFLDCPLTRTHGHLVGHWDDSGLLCQR